MFKFDFKRSFFSFSADTTLQAFEHSSSKTKLNQRIKDDALDIDAIPQYALSLEVSNDGFRCAIVDTEVNRCLWLEDYRFTSVFFPEQVVDQLNSIFDDHQLLQAGFWQKVRVSFKNQHFTLIPESLFKREYAEGYLRFSAESLKDTEEVYFYQHANREIVNVFAGEKKVADWFRNTYPSRNVSFVHHTSAFIEGVLQHEDYVPARSMSILVESSYLTVLVTNNYLVEYCNTFFYLSAQDFIYYVMLVMDELRLNPDACRVTLYGEISHDSAIHDVLYKYIRNISFGSKPTALKFSFQFDEMMDHRYFDVFNAYLCD
jgi:hypothetical protein